MSSLETQGETESIEDIDRQLQAVQEEINRLVHKKKTLEARKSSLKANKYLQKSLELSKEDWDKGELSFLFSSIILKPRLLRSVY